MIVIAMVSLWARGQEYLFLKKKKWPKQEEQKSMLKYWVAPVMLMLTILRLLPQEVRALKSVSNWL